MPLLVLVHARPASDVETRFAEVFANFPNRRCWLLRHGAPLGRAVSGPPMSDAGRRRSSVSRRRRATGSPGAYSAPATARSAARTGLPVMASRSRSARRCAAPGPDGGGRRGEASSRNKAERIAAAQARSEVSRSMISRPRNCCRSAARWQRWRSRQEAAERRRVRSTSSMARGRLSSRRAPGRVRSPRSISPCSAVGRCWRASLSAGAFDEVILGCVNVIPTR